MCRDHKRVVGFMDADGPGANGVRYDQWFCHMFELRDGLIREVWEFFENEIAEKVFFLRRRRTAR